MGVAGYAGIGEAVELLEGYMKGILKKESHYFRVGSFFVLVYVFYMHFLFNKTWADSEKSIRLILWVEKVVPVVSSLRGDRAVYSNFWGLFFSLFWLSSPLYWMLGYFGAPWLSADRYRKYVIATTIGRVVCLLLILSLGVGFAFIFPILNGMMILNQTSDYFPILSLSWWYVAGVIYAQAQALRVLLVKIDRTKAS